MMFLLHGFILGFTLYLGVSPSHVTNPPPQDCRIGTDTCTAPPVHCGSGVCTN